MNQIIDSLKPQPVWRSIGLELHHDISQFLYAEAQLLDDWKFRDWLDILSEDILYTLKTTTNAQTRDRRRLLDAVRYSETLRLKSRLYLRCCLRSPEEFRFQGSQTKQHLRESFLCGG